MTIEEIQSRKEGQTFDRKSINIKPKDLAPTIIAMANADGGDINSEGLPNHVLVLHIEPGLRVYANQADEVYLRVGDKSKKLTFDERLQLMNDKGQACYEETCLMSAVMTDIDMELVAEYCKIIGYGKSAENFIRETNGYSVEKNGMLRPTVVSMLLFGKKLQDFMPRAQIRFIRFDGTEEKVGTQMNVIKDIVFCGTVRQQIDKAVEFLGTQVKEHTFLGDNGLFVTEVEYPEFVRQEIIVNAVCHRDYSIAGTEIQIKLFNDRLVVESPGKLPGLVNKDNIRYTHFSRNPRIAQYLKAYKYVKEYGEGVDRMCREMEEDGLQPIRYYCNDFILKAIALNKEADSVIAEDGKVAVSSGKVAVSSGKVAVTWDEIRSTCNANAVKILEYLSSHQSITNAVAREITGLSSPGVRKILSNLVENKIIRSIGTYRDKSYSLVRHFEDKVSR